MNKHLLLILLGFGLIGCAPSPESKAEQVFLTLKESLDPSLYRVIEREFANAEMPICDEIPEVPTAQTTCKWIGQWEDNEQIFIYMGSWKDGKPNGYGIGHTFKPLSQYIGEWKDGRWHGQGTENTFQYRPVAKWTNYFVGEWENGERLRGTSYTTNDWTFTSEAWQEEPRVGILTSPDGEQNLCKWVDNTCVDCKWVNGECVETTKPSVNKAKSSANKVKTLSEQVIEAQQRLLKGPSRNPELYSACSKDFQRYMQPFLDLRAERLKIGDQTALLDYRDVHLPTGQQFYLSCLRDGFRF